MTNYTAAIQDTARRLLDTCAVDMVIGFRRGSLPLMNQPCIVRQAADADQLVWDGNCGINLTNYLTDRKEAKIGIVAKGCDSRNIVTHILENKITREQLVIIGVPCRGMLDKRRIGELVDGEIHSVSEDGTDQITVTVAGTAHTFARQEVLQHNCRVCAHPNPVVYDELVGEMVAAPAEGAQYADVEKVEAMTPEGRRQFFDDLLAPCIRCYACRNACPLCYCPTCFVDESRPQWVGKGQHLNDTRTFHFLRAYHCAGRCTDCGSCERACPMGIRVRLLTRKLEKDCLELYGWEAGLTPDQRPALDVYQANDPQEFIK